MKKLLYLAAVAATLVSFASCQEKLPVKGVDEMQEMTFSNVARTKGYITAADFYDTAIAEIHKASPVTTPRQLFMSAYVTPQNGSADNYFVDEPFAINANGETDDLWHHAPKLYWPLDATLDFLAYSAQNRLTGTKCVWDEANASSKVVLNVSEAQSQDDIVYAGNFNNSTSDASVAMEFKHTQAWIEFKLKASEADLITITDISLADIYQKGELTIRKNGTVAEHAWNFASYTARNTTVDANTGDLYYVYGSALKVTDEYLDMLIPAQGQTSIIISYKLAGQDTVLSYKYDLVTSTWEAGKKYIYEILFQPQEITVTPSVTAFTNADVTSDGFPSTLK